MGKKLGYGLITKHVALDPEVTADAKAVYMVLCSMADKNGVCNPVVKTIRACTGLSEYRFYNAMQNLREKGIVTTRQSKEGTMFARNTYQLLDRPYLKISGTAFDKDNPKDLGTGRTGNTQAARTSIDSDAIPPYPTDLGVKQYQCLNITNNKNKTNYNKICDLLNMGKQKAGSKGRLKIAGAHWAIPDLKQDGVNENEILQAAQEAANQGADLDWYSFGDFVKYRKIPGYRRR